MVHIIKNVSNNFGKYRQMNGGNFLVGLREKIHKICSLMKEDIDIFESDIFCKSNAEKREEFNGKLSCLVVEIMESELTEESYQVSFTIAGYVAKEILKKISCVVCKNKLI